jgi:diguanylate cyclase (GGDEF)-like protein
MMQPTRLIFFDNDTLLGAKAIPSSLAASFDHVTSLVDFINALEKSQYEVALIHADQAEFLGKSGEVFCQKIIDQARRFDVMTAVMVNGVTATDCCKLIQDGFDDILHEPQHVRQFEAQLHSIRRIAKMRRELNRRQSTLREFLAIVNDVDLDICFDQNELVHRLNDAEIVLLDLDPEKSGATLVYPQLRECKYASYYDDLDKAQAKVFQDKTGLLIINAVGKAENALSMIANMRASATLYNYPVLLVVQSEESPTSEQVFAAGASDYIEGEIAVNSLVPRLQSVLRHEQLRRHFSTKCETPAEAIVLDNLTGFYTPGFARAHIQHLEDSLKVHDQPLTAAVISLDNIKRINKEFGFAAGESIIRQSANIVRNCLRGEDFTARMSGTKFLLLFPESELMQARIAMNRINNILNYTTLSLASVDVSLQVIASFNIMQWTKGDILEDFVFASSTIKSCAA